MRQQDQFASEIEDIIEQRAEERAQRRLEEAFTRMREQLFGPEAAHGVVAIDRLATPVLYVCRCGVKLEPGPMGAHERESQGS